MVAVGLKPFGMLLHQLDISVVRMAGLSVFCEIKRRITV